LPKETKIIISKNILFEDLILEYSIAIYQKITRYFAIKMQNYRYQLSKNKLQ